MTSPPPPPTPGRSPLGTWHLWVRDLSHRGGGGGGGGRCGEGGCNLPQCRKAICLPRGTPQLGQADTHLQGWGAPALGRHVVHLRRQRWQRGPCRSGHREEGLGERRAEGRRRHRRVRRSSSKLASHNKGSPDSAEALSLRPPLTGGPSLQPRAWTVGGEARWRGATAACVSPTREAG